MPLQTTAPTAPVDTTSTFTPLATVTRAALASHLCDWCERPVTGVYAYTLGEQRESTLACDVHGAYWSSFDATVAAHGWDAGNALAGPMPV